MTEGVELVRGIGPGAVNIAHLPAALGAFACRHFVGGARPACNINIDGGDIPVVCEEAACREEKPELTFLCRVLHFAPDIGALGPARDGRSIDRRSADVRWMVWAPDAEEPVEFRRAFDA